VFLILPVISPLITPCSFTFPDPCIGSPPPSLNRPLRLFVSSLPARLIFQPCPLAPRWPPLPHPPFRYTNLGMAVGILGPALRAGSPRSTAPWSCPPRPGSASLTDRPTPLAASRPRRRGCPSSRLLGPPYGSAPSTLGLRAPSGARAALARGLRGYDWSRLGPLQRITSPLGCTSPFITVPLVCGTSRPTLSAVRRCAFRKATRLDRSQMRLGSAQWIAASVSAQGLPQVSTVAAP
jgi:hypothetical protein